MMRPPFSITNKMLNLIVEITQKVTWLELEKERNLHLRKENRIRSIHSLLAIEENALSFDQVSDIINGKHVFGAPKEIREVHFEIEMIHPFSDGNGRMGRLWQNLILSKWKRVFE